MMLKRLLLRSMSRLVPHLTLRESKQLFGMTMSKNTLSSAGKPLNRVRAWIGRFFLLRALLPSSFKLVLNLASLGRAELLSVLCPRMGPNLRTLTTREILARIRFTEWAVFKQQKTEI